MGLADEVYGIGADLAGPLALIKAVKKNYEREKNFPGQTLSLYAMTPDGETELVSFDRDWTARREENPGTGENESIWIFEILEQSYVTPATMKKVATIRIGDTKFKVKKRFSTAGNLRKWTAEAEMIA